MNLKCGYFTVGGIMCGSLVGIFVGALAVNASLGYMILLLGACTATPERSPTVVAVSDTGLNAIHARIDDWKRGQR